jgi:hypothetical protein
MKTNHALSETLSANRTGSGDRSYILKRHSRLDNATTQRVSRERLLLHLHLQPAPAPEEPVAYKSKQAKKKRKREREEEEAERKADQGESLGLGPRGECR